MARKNHTEDEILDVYGRLHRTRTIFLTSANFDNEGTELGVDTVMAEKFLKNLHILESYSADPVTIIMNNIGGDEYHGMAIYDAIQLSKCHITIKVFGHAMSMGSIILQAADTRLISPHSMVMLHYGEMHIGGHSAGVIRNAKEIERFNRFMEEMYLERIREKNPKYSLKQLRSAMAHDLFLTAEQSIKLGLADGVIE